MDEAEIVTTIDPATIAGVIEATMGAYQMRHGRLPNAVMQRGPRSVWVDSGVGVGEFNSVVRVRCAADEAEAEIAAVLGHFARVERPVVWHVGPTATPPDLGERLLAHGCAFVEEEPLMAMVIAEAPLDEPLPPGLTIAMVGDERALRDWSDVWLFPLEEGARQYLCEISLQIGIDDELPWRYFVGRLDGKPVATSMVNAGAGVAGVQLVVTVPEARRRGFGRAMTLAAMREGAAQGYQVAVLTASPDGFGVYRRLGFEEYGRVRRYEWSPATEGR